MKKKSNSNWVLNQKKVRQPRPVMSWSQIKQTPYDFSDLQITGEYDDRPGTGRFLRFPFVRSHIVQAPAGVCI